jgi:hypothetical protein
VADDAGALLVRSGLVTSTALDDARVQVGEQGGTIGEQLVFSGVIADDVLTDFYKSRLLVPQVNPNTLARLPAKVVAVIPSDMAIELRAIPVSLDADNNLTVAMSDPSDSNAVDEISFFSGTYVVRAVATQMQIAWCLAHYYGHVTGLGQRLLQPSGSAPARAVQAAVKPPTRTRGVTAEVNAQRKHAMVPVRAESPPPEATAAPETPAPRARSVSGEIRVPVRRAPSIKPPLPEDSEPSIKLPDDSGPVTLDDSGPVTRPLDDSGAVTRPPDDSGPVTRPPDDSGPVISLEADEPDEAEAPPPPVEPAPPVPRRKRPADPDPPELAARAGELRGRAGADKPVSDDEPRIVISGDLTDDRSLGNVSGELRVREHRDELPPPATVSVELDDEPSAPVVIHAAALERSEPVLLDRRSARPSDAPTSVSVSPAPSGPDDVDDEVVELAAKKPAGRPDRRTQVGIGVVRAVTRAKNDTDDVDQVIDDLPTGSRRLPDDADPTRVDTHAAPPGDYTSSSDRLAAPPAPYEREEDTSPHMIPPLPSLTTPGPSGQIKLDGVKPAGRLPVGDDDDAAQGPPTTVMPAVDPADDDDDGWGPPGTTIPPALLGAIPGTITPASGIIPIPSIDDDAPLIVAPPTPPEAIRSTSVSDIGLLSALEDATSQMLELIRHLERAGERDQVVEAMMEHLASSHRRAGFFAARKDELQLFAIIPRPPMIPYATLRLDRPSTLADVVGTRLPYRGPMHDEASRAFLSASLGACPPEILLVPITVRDRVVGVLFGEGRRRHTFDDQLALAARAAGNALERILKARRG